MDDLLNLANRYYSFGDVDAGLKMANEALAMARGTTSNPRQLAWALHTVGLGHQLKRDLNQARDFHTQAIAVLDQVGGQRTDSDAKGRELLLSSILNNFANLSGQEGRFVEAESMARRALELRSRHLEVSDEGLVSVLNTIIDVLSDTQREAELLPYQNHLLSIYDAAGEQDSPQALKVVITLARLYEDMGIYPEAERLYTRALETRQRFLSPDHVNIASSMADLAAFLTNQGRLQEAERLFNQSLSILERRSGPDSLDVAKLLNDMAAVYFPRNPDLAETSLRRALAIYSSRDTDRIRTATVMTNLADLLRGRKQYKEAEGLLAEADETYKRLGGRLKGFFFLARGNLHLALQRLDEAEADFRRARDILHLALGSTSGAEIMTAEGIVSAQVRRQDWMAARAELADVTDIIVQGLRRGGDSLGRPIVGGTSLGARFAAQHVGELSQVLYRQGLGQPDGIQGNAAPAFIASQWSIRPAAATAVASMAVRTVTESEKLHAMIRDRQDLVLKWRQIDSRRTVLFASDSHIELEERRRAQTELEETDAQIRAIDAELQREFPSFASYANPEPLSIPQTQQMLRSDEVLLSILSTDGAGDLPGETFIWAITQGDFRWARVDLSSDAVSEKVQALRCGLDSEEWEGISRPAHCGRLLRLRARPRLADPLPFHLGIAHELYLALLGQVEDLIKGKHLLIVPSGPLTSLPFQVLVTEQPPSALPKTFDGYKGVAWLGRRQPLTILPSVASLQALRKFATASTAERPYLGYGDPVLLGDGACRLPIAREACTAPLLTASTNRPMRVRERSDVRSGSIDRIYRKGAGQEAVVAEVRTLCPLPDTAFELRCVAKSLGVPENEIRLGPSATETDIKRLSETHELENYRVVHFATHGLLAGDTEAMARRQGEPALVMTPPDRPKDADDDGLLTASEVAQLKLNADWVILSACNTAAGDKLGAEALSGLARAFFYAGTRALLVSHWPVYSDAAVQLLNMTFAELRRNPTLGRSEALRRAMVDLMDDPDQEDNPHPSIWAPFSLTGEGAN
ncbi:CHAT domain-containing tetratricopeptide repeat protein [Rhizobium sophoriradicis]|uniref:CHAT domain-containing tetratricopeptide repeat protein n=1 Tax=Rhizobium sophoriradicis TaxID=1535245 RepID=UPI001179ADA5|nr:CHAT domain-containing protein [Rhizobium sophoriradicis]